MSSTFIIIIVVVAIGIMAFSVILLRRAEDDPLLARIDEFAAREEIVSIEEIELSCNEDLDDEFFAEMMDLGETIRFRLAKQGKEPRSSLGRIGEFFFRLYDSIGKNDFSHSFFLRMPF